MNVRLVAAVAHIFGHDISSMETQGRILAVAMATSSVMEYVGQAGGVAGTKFTKALITKIPGKLLIAINKQVGFRLFTKAGEKGVINLIKLAPVAGYDAMQ
jgi:hypothetical protein